jgi:hypothetical protein
VAKQKQATKGTTMTKHYPDTAYVSAMKLAEHLSKPPPPWVDYMQECWNPRTGRTVVRTVKREYAPWFLDAMQGAKAL